MAIATATAPGPQDRMRQLASQAAWTEVRGKVVSPLVSFNDQGTNLPLYVVHSLSGKATDYGALARLLGEGQPFHAIQVPMANRTADFGGVGADVERVARFYADAVMAFQPDGALALGGWSVGAVVALEMARQLRLRGRDIALLVAFDLAPWNTSQQEPHGLRYWASVVANAPGWLLGHRLVRAGKLAPLRDAVLARLGLRRPVPGAKKVPTLGAGIVTEDLVNPAHYPDGHVALMRNLLDATIRYRPQPYEGAVQAYVAGTEVSLTHLPRLKAAWRAVAPHARVLRVAGSHRSMIESPDGAALAAHLVELLRR